MVAQKKFATVETCDDDEPDRLNLKSLYSEKRPLPLPRILASEIGSRNFS